MAAYPDDESLISRWARQAMGDFDGMGPWERMQARNRPGPWQRQRCYYDEPVIPTKRRNRALPLPAAMRHLMGPPSV